MAHFAELDADDIVLRVIAVSNDELLDQFNREREVVGIAFCQSLFGAETKWAQTSYNANFRGKFAGIGDKYDRALDAFVVAS